MAILRFSKWRPSAILDLWNSKFLMVGKVKMCWWWWWHGRLDCMCWWWQGSMLQSIERYMKQAIVDKEPSVSSAALTSSLVSQCLVFISFDAVVTAYNTVSVNAWSSFHLTPLSLHVTQCQSRLGRHFIWRRCHCMQHSVSQSVDECSWSVSVYHVIISVTSRIESHMIGHTDGHVVNQGLDLQNILRQSYDNAKVTIDLRRMSNLQNILRRTHGFF